MHQAAHQGDVKRVRGLAHHWNVNEPDANGTRPLHEAANAAVAQTLVDAGARPSSRDGRERTPLHRAIMDERCDVAEYLICGTTAMLNWSDDRGRMPLHYAAIKDDGATTGVLLRMGAKPFEKDLDGNTPMRLAMTRACGAFVGAFLNAAM